MEIIKSRNNENENGKNNREKSIRQRTGSFKRSINYHTSKQD